MQHVLAGLIVAATALGATLGSTTYSSYAFGKRYTVEITDHQLSRAPKWEDDAENPPLAAHKAIALATELKDTLVQRNDEYLWRFDGATLKRDEEDERWYWLVDFVARSQKRKSIGQPHHLRLAVLMDGTVIKPVVKDDR